MTHWEASAPSRATTMNATIRRLRTGAPSCPWSHRPEPVAESPDRLDVAWLGGVRFDLGPQPLHARVDQPGVAQVVVLPDQGEKLLAGEDLPGRAGQDQQQ